jgi:hypothetical protein
MANASGLTSPKIRIICSRLVQGGICAAALNRVQSLRPRNRGASCTTSNAPDRQIGGAGTRVINNPGKSISVTGFGMSENKRGRKALVDRPQRSGSPPWATTSRSTAIDL